MAFENLELTEEFKIPHTFTHLCKIAASVSVGILRDNRVIYNAPHVVHVVEGTSEVRCQRRRKQL